MKITHSTLRLGLASALAGAALLFTACPPSSGLKYCATGAKCPDGTVCAGYYCRPTACEKEACSENEVCNPQGQCIPSECADVKCATGKVCVKGGKCMPADCTTPKSVTCTDGTVCNIDGTCVEPSCFMAPCVPTEEICSGGNCIYKKCGPGETDCPDGQACGDDGTCQDALCIYKSCPEGKSCKAGACVDCSEGGTGCKCGGATCATGESCVNSACKPISCEGVACRLGETCGKDGKSCVTVDCYEKTCSSSQVCVKGTCESSTCGSATCVQGQSCQSGTCVDALCAGKTCGSGQVCAAGRCLPTTSCGTAAVTCPTGQACDAGRCVDVRCIDAVCPSGKTCSAGVCVSNNCASQACRTGEVCAKDGKTCVEAACAQVSCPTDQICVGGKCESAVCGAATCVQGQSCKDGSCVDALCLSADCPYGSQCVSGKCYTTWCGDNYDPCPTGTLCDQGRCTEVRCVGVSCPSGQTCAGGQCVAGEGCPSSGCPNGQTCLSGSCRDSTCTSAGCKADQYCVDGACTTASCAGVSCPTDQICVGGNCVSAACGTSTCVQGQICDEATLTCVDSVCATVTCGSGQICVGGECVTKDCPGGVKCPSGQACVSGHCQDTSCLGVYCPAGSYCQDGTCDHACQASETNCGDGVDEDCDGAVDCADPDCDAKVCNDGDGCTTSDACSSGLCVGPNAKTCPAPADDCHTGSGQCKSSTGKCEYAQRSTGAPCTVAAPAACTAYACTGAGTCSGSPAQPDTTCGAGQICNATGSCVSSGGAQCIIGGAPYAAGAANPGNPCQYCSPSQNNTAWSPKAAGTTCAGGACDSTGVCRAGCVIGSTFYATGAADPSSACRTCDPTKSANDWTVKTTGTSCGTGKMCDALGSCVTGCNIGGKVRLDGQVNPANPCQVCDSAKSTTAWSSAEDGRSCASGKICQAGTCKDGCWIEGAFVAPKTVSPGDECQACLPATSAAAYSRNDGATCSEGKCINGKCIGGCTITTVSGSGGTIVETKTKYADGAANPKNECQWCEIKTSALDWTNKADGTECSGGKTCLGGGCGEGCVVGDKHYGPGEKNATNACLYCDPAQSTSKLSQMADNEVCGAGKMCYHSLCSNICLIDGIPYPEKSIFPDDPATPGVDESDPCLQCDPTRHFFSWSGCKAHSVCWEEVAPWDDELGKFCRLGCVEKASDSDPLDYYENGEVNPKETCQICDINYDNYHWKPRNEALDCIGKNVCNHEGHCAWGCGIGGHYYAPDQMNPWNTCAICKNAQAVHSWTYFANGTSCDAGGGVCYNNSCQDGCWIGGAYYGDGATHGSSGNPACEKCDTDKSRSGWQLNGGASCGTNQKCSTKTATCCAAGASDC